LAPAAAHPTDRVAPSRPAGSAERRVRYDARMKVGFCLPAGDDPDAIAGYARVRSMARRAEALGFDSVWVSDHLLFRFPGEAESGLLEGWTVLAALAEATERVELGELVLCTGFRNPGLLAKMAQTLDAISGGRLVLGLGAGWHDPEYEAFGYPTDHKVGRFEEALEVIASLIRTGRSSLDGRWTTMRDATHIPPARPDLPILVAASRPRMLELTARLADAWNGAWAGRPSAPSLIAQMATLDEACRAIGRDPASLARTVGLRIDIPGLVPPTADPPGPDRVLRGTTEEIASGLAAFERAGYDHAMVWLEPETQMALERLGEALARYRELASAPA
jgi:alkanesulfonate monooxygenase SsuD/methylene tetrahydromethanopterin reductase-like flavin-dependent oxidoreductase (luciferase family)